MRGHGHGLSLKEKGQIITVLSFGDALCGLTVWRKLPTQQNEPRHPIINFLGSRKHGDVVSGKSLVKSCPSNLAGCSTCGHCLKMA